MKKQLIQFLLVISLCSSSNLFGQVVIYSEDFDGPLTWSINTDLGVEDANPNFWYISCEEEGVGAGVCSETCGVGDQTLHVGRNPLGVEVGATYAETGAGFTTTDRRAESDDISTIGHEDLTLGFDYIGQGNLTDYCEVFYSIDGGVAWISLEAPLTSLCCGGIPCTGAELGLWGTRTYLLPATCEEILNLRVSFVWKNNDDGIITDPSFAVDNITIEKPVVVVIGGPTALFDPEDITICQGESITYTDLSVTTDVITDWNWVFDGGAPGGALTAGPHVVTYTTPGIYTTTLTVTDGIGSHDTSFTVTVQDGPYAGESESADLCEGEFLDLNTLLLGADFGGTWVETSVAPSGTFTSGTGVLDGGGLTIGDVFTFDYETLVGIAPCPGTDIATFTITIVECGPLFASFLPSSTNICQDDCITFLDESTGDITGWVWTFTDVGIGGPLIGADPGTICFSTAGAIDVTLTVTDGVAFDDTTITITVNPAPVVTANATSTTICEGGSVTLFGGGDALGFTWSGGAVEGVELSLDVTSTFTVTGVNAFGCSASEDITITVVPCEPLLAGFELDNIVCVGDCITLTDTSSGDPVEWLWDFGGASDPLTSTEQNPEICFTTAGEYDIQLTVMNVIGETSSTINSVTVFESPTVDAALDTIIDVGGQAVLVATGSIPGVYTWEPDDYIDCETCPFTTASPPLDYVYIVTLLDVNGCTGIDSVRVFVNFIEAIGVADVFSPNGDGQNDVLFVQGFGLESVAFSVYNKYGEQVFESRTQDIGWDGRFKGKDQNPGVFAWVLEYQFVNGKSGLLKGNTTLLR